METNGFFQFEMIINVLVSSLRFIWIPVLYVYDHYKCFTLVLQLLSVYFRKAWKERLEQPLTSLKGVSQHTMTFVAEYFIISHSLKIHLLTLTDTHSVSLRYSGYFIRTRTQWILTGDHACTYTPLETSCLALGQETVWGQQHRGVCACAGWWGGWIIPLGPASTLSIRIPSQQIPTHSMTQCCFNVVPASKTLGQH